MFFRCVLAKNIFVAPIAKENIFCALVGQVFGIIAFVFVVF